MNRLRLLSAVTSLGLIYASTANAIFLDGEGHYGLRGETRTNPGYGGYRGMYQAIEQTFRLRGEVRSGDRSSFFTEFRLFDNERAAYLGDTPQPSECARTTKGANGTDITTVENTGFDTNCEGRHQDTGEPGYKPYVPKITLAYARYAFDYCILEAGRRPRDWGLGIFLNSGKNPFDSVSSVYDGVTCSVNTQKSQTLGFSFGYDKLAETGVHRDFPAPSAAEDSEPYGASTRADDLDQFFLTVEYDDRKANAGSGFTRQVGIYFANVVSSKSKTGTERDSRTDVKFADLYTGLFFQNFAFRNEVLFRLGKSADPAWTRLGGAGSRNNDLNVNNVQSIGAAGSLEWTLSRSGSLIGPAEYNQGNATRHLLFVDYAYAPGDSDGYLPDVDNQDVVAGLGSSGDASEPVRGRDAKAMAFSRNYKPALLLFNDHAEQDGMRVDGVYDPGRVMNASVVGLGYRYENVASGNIETKILMAQLDQGISQKAKDIILAQEEIDAKTDKKVKDRPVGFAGSGLGYELNLKYTRQIGRELEFGVTGAYGIAGDAYRVRQDEAAANSFAVQSHLVFKF